MEDSAEGIGIGGNAEEELVIERLRRINDVLNKQLQKQSDQIQQQTIENQRYRHRKQG